MPFEATRYHSLVVAREGLPDCLEISAKTDLFVACEPRRSRLALGAGGAGRSDQPTAGQSRFDGLSVEGVPG